MLAAGARETFVVIFLCDTFAIVLSTSFASEFIKELCKVSLTDDIISHPMSQGGM